MKLGSDSHLVKFASGYPLQSMGAAALDIFGVPHSVTPCVSVMPNLVAMPSRIVFALTRIGVIWSYTC